MSGESIVSLAVATISGFSDRVSISEANSISTKVKHHLFGFSRHNLYH